MRECFYYVHARPCLSLRQTQTQALLEEAGVSPSFLQERRPPTAGKLPPVLEKCRNNENSSSGHI